jgi:hypothetical protein
MLQVHHYPPSLVSTFVTNEFVANGVHGTMVMHCGVSSCAPGTNVFVAFAGGTAQRGPYEDIVGAVHQSVPHTDVSSPVEYPANSKMPPPYHS